MLEKDLFDSDSDIFRRPLTGGGSIEPLTESREENVFLWSLFQAAIAAPNTCVPIDASDILEIPPPAVIVLGERHGMQPDLRRAERITKGLQRAAPVTIALEAIHQKHQVVLDNFAANKLEPSARSNPTSIGKIPGAFLMPPTLLW